MPHLLIAGTTGSGKSVGLNAMILSLLYRLGPNECRMIMIDPKMLELKTYDGIPHLLAPVVTDPPKAIRALKWAVEQMEDRYRKMSEINVRSLANFNQKVPEAKAAGKPFIRRVQTGWDPETEMPIIEEEILEFETMPLIVVVVDELADLMMTAGKEVEFLIQRLAQKARAAGIHLIMATQRPSVDVITGVIKANLPTRISFQVTSKIDSRTILGEQGAEQLLGKGDMLWMSGGKQLIRVHGPFVTDDEVEAVADHWRRQGQPGLYRRRHRRTRRHRRPVRLRHRPARQRRRRRRQLRPRHRSRRGRPKGLDQLPPAAVARRLQQRRPPDRADGTGRLCLETRPCRPARSADRRKRRAAVGGDG